MKEYKVGEQIVLEVKKSALCDGCFFEEICNDSDTRIYPCSIFTKQGNVIFVEKKGK